MCVICHAAKKRYMKRAEVVQAMKSNNAGFFGFTVHDGARRMIRTLDDKEFLKFFDECVGDDDVWVMHARIPSRGKKTIANVHGWEQDGILFCHNMTLSQLDDMMRNAKWEGTDSEFFFRHVFIPFYRGCGPDAYKDGKFCEDLDNLVRHFCGHYNKFLFIMPDDTVVRYGEWVAEPDRKEGGECAFYASNSSYKVYERTWPKAAVDGFGRSRYAYDDLDYGYDEYGGYYPASAATAGSKSAGFDFPAMVLKGIGTAGLCKLALCDIVAHGVSAYKSIPDGWDRSLSDGDDVADVFYQLMPNAFTDDTYDAAAAALANLGDETAEELYTVTDFAEQYADEFGPALAKTTGTGKVAPLFMSEDAARRALSKLLAEWRVFQRVAAVNVNWRAKSPASFAAVADRPEFEDGAWKIKKVRATDILVDESTTNEIAFRAIGKLLKFIQAYEAGEIKEDTPAGTPAGTPAETPAEDYSETPMDDLTDPDPGIGGPGEGGAA